MGGQSRRGGWNRTDGVRGAQSLDKSAAPPALFSCSREQAGQMGQIGRAHV